jgi:predicted ATPase
LLDQLSVAGFKAIFDSGPVRLGPLNLLIGRNGSGKSSLIEALQWLQESIYFGLDKATFDRFGPFPGLVNRRSEIVEVDLLFDEGPSEVRYRLDVKPRSGDWRPIVARESCRVNRKTKAVWPIVSRKGPRGAAVRSLAKARMNAIRDGDTLALGAFNSPRLSVGATRLNAFLRNAVFLRLSPEALGDDDQLGQRRGPLLVDDGRGTVALLNSLNAKQRASVVEQIREVIAGAQKLRVRAVERGYGHVELSERMLSRGGTRTYPIPSWLLSEGTRRLVTLFALLAVDPRPSLIAVEEVENGLDPWTLQKVFRALRIASDEGVQIVLTTHSPFLLDHVNADEIIRVERARGHTTFQRVTDLTAVAEFNGVIAPGAMYLSGALEGGHE